MSRKKIIVTGGAGYIGSHTVVELVKAGFDPIIVDNFCNSNREVLHRLELLAEQKIKCYAIDCNDKRALSEVFWKEGKIDGVIHFAAYKAVCESVKSPLKYYDNNIGSLTSILEVMGEHNVSNFVFSSTCAVYGEPKSYPVDEKTPLLSASSPYGHTKQICEQIIEDVVASEQKLKAVTLRYFNPIGAHPSGLIGEWPLFKPANLVPFLTQTAAGLRPELVIHGGDYNTPDGTCIRDYIHVVDLAKAHIHALEWATQSPNKISSNEVFNVGLGKGSSVKEVIGTFEEVAGIKVNYRIGKRRNGDVEKIFASVDKAKDVLGWEATHSLSKALRDAWNWQSELEGKFALAV